MSKENKKIVRRGYELFEAGDLDVVLGVQELPGRRIVRGGAGSGRD